MNTNTLHRLLIVISMAAVLVLSGCSGGDTKMPDDETTAMPDDDTTAMPDDDTTAMPDDDTTAMPDDDTTAMPDDDTTAMPDDDTTMMPEEEVEPLTIPEGLARSMAAPVHAGDADTLATLLPNPANLFAPLAALFGGDSGDQSPGSELASDLRVKTVSSDGSDGFRVTYVAGGEEQTIHFEAADYLDGQYYYAKVVDGTTYFLATHTDSFERASKSQGPSGYRYLDHNQFGISDQDAGTIERNYISYGARTDTSGLPAGEATYVGSMEAFTYLKDNPSTAQRERMRGGMRLSADFDAGTVDGLILGINVRRSGERDDSPLSDTTWFEIGNGRIVDGQFAATLTGMDSNAGAPMDDTVLGYEGGILGELYGPASEEVGGVLNASRSDRVMAGMFGGTRLDPNGPNGLVASTAAPAVYANDADDTLEELTGGDTRFAPLNSTLLRDWSVRTVKLSGDSHIEALWVDGDGAHVTYVIEGEEQMISFTLADLKDDGSFEKEQDDGGHSWWSHTRRFDGDWNYRWLDVNTFVRWGGGPSSRHYISYGARTDASSLPAGSATYAGGMGAENFNQSDPSLASSRIRMRGDLTLMANFDDSTLNGAISGIDVRRPGEDSYSSLPDTTHFTIGNGQIAGGRFSAVLTGMDTNPAAPLRDTVRGFQGDVLGEFYGPAAEEVGGVFSATRNEDLRVMGGAFHGRQQQ